MTRINLSPFFPGYRQHSDRAIAYRFARGIAGKNTVAVGEARRN
jgi:hypothetical protein